MLRWAFGNYIQSVVMERFGPYRLVRRLATGGMAEVFLARQLGIEGFEREVVIKRILPHRAQDEEFCTMFLDEARLIARLNHPYIAQVYDLGQEGGTYFIAMEHVQGIDLSHLLDAAADQGTPGLPMPVAVAVISSLCQALEYIHSRTDELGHPLNIVHRDLNPKNVIISFEGAVKLIDFGIAKAASQVYETRTGVIKGTYGYMAPEQVSRQHAIDLRADLFSLGVLTYELTTGIHPFDAADEVAVLGKLVRCQFAPPSRTIRNYPEALEQIILACMAQDPNRRPSSASKVLSLVEDFALQRQIPLTMSRIATYVQRNHTEQAERVTSIPPLVVADGDSTAMISQRLAHRADQEVGTLATSMLGPSGAQRDSTLPANDPRASARAPQDQRPGFQWPWSTWGRRERVVALVATTVALFATIASVLLIVAAVEPNETPGHAIASGNVTEEPSPLLTNATAEPTPFRQPSEPAKSTDAAIRVESVPPNAHILVEGTASEEVTPATIPVPEGKSLVWIRVELDGYVPDERQVAAAVGEVVFTLSESP